MIEDKEIYHIVFKTKESDFYSKGVNVEANSIDEALLLFKEMHIFYRIYLIYLKSN